MPRDREPLASFFHRSRSTRILAMEATMSKICIIGGGAAGMAAAISASRSIPGNKITVLEKNSEPGKKIYATGNGRCNLTNSNCGELPAVLELFEEAGIAVRREAEGRMYPYSERAADVAQALVHTMKLRHIDLRCEMPVTDIGYDGKEFMVTTAFERISAQKVLIATGGKAGPQFGSTGDGYGLARRLGHNTTRIFPVLTPLESSAVLRDFKGVRLQAKASLVYGEQVVAVEKGELQFTEDGISGIMVFNLSASILLPGILPLPEELKSYQVEVDLFPDTSLEGLAKMLTERKKMDPTHPDAWLRTLVHPALAKYFLDKILMGGNRERRSSNFDDASNLACLLKSWILPVTGVKGWKSAQCTGGGIAHAEIDSITGKSLLVPGLYFAGEIMGFAGPCGGYNLHHAWLTGLRAGMDMSNELV